LSVFIILYTGGNLGILFLCCRRRQSAWWLHWFWIGR